MSSRSLATARSRRSGDLAPPVSGNRPITSIGSQAAFAQQMPPNINYNMPPPPNNVRTHQMQNQSNNTHMMMQQKNEKQMPHPPQNNMPFTKLSISDAIGLITLRLGRVEQWMIDTDHENTMNGENNNSSSSQGGNVPQNHTVIDTSVLTSIINRLDSLEKNNGNSSSDKSSSLIEDVATSTKQISRIGEDVTKHTLELSKNTESVFRFNRELTETKDILKSFMVKYDLFSSEITLNFTDYENALADLEKRLIVEPIVVTEEQPVGTNISDIDGENVNIIMSADLKSMISQELANI
jgi:hypothetical protein